MDRSKVSNVIASQADLVLNHYFKATHQPSWEAVSLR